MIAAKQKKLAAPERTTRDILVEAACREFNEVGYHGTNTNKIARIAGLVYGTAARVANLDHQPVRDNLGPRVGKGQTGRLEGRQGQRANGKGQR